MASVSVEAVREQLESMGRNVPEDLIETFLRDLGVEPVLSPSAEREKRGAGPVSQLRGRRGGGGGRQ